MFISYKLHKGELNMINEMIDFILDRAIIIIMLISIITIGFAIHHAIGYLVILGTVVYYLSKIVMYMIDNTIKEND